VRDYPNASAKGWRAAVEAHVADTERIRALEDAERACKAANESQRTTIAALEAQVAVLIAGGDLIAQAGDRALDRAAKAETNEENLEVRLRQANALVVKAEARVKELEATIRKKWTVADSVNAILDVGLRGEGRG
jgi:predicted transposase YbfD/YdcC